MEVPALSSSAASSLPSPQTKENETVEQQIERQSEFHDDFTTVLLRKNSLRGEMTVVAHLGLPGGALSHFQECRRVLLDCQATLEKRDLVRSKSNLTSNLADLHNKLGLLNNTLTKFGELIQVPDGAISPSLRAVFILVEKYLLNVQTHLSPLKSKFYHPRVGLMLGRHQRSKIHTDCRKLNGVLTIMDYSFLIYSKVSKNGRLCPFLIGEELEHFNIEEYANSIDIYPFLISINKHYQGLLRTAYSGLLKATAAAMHASHHSDAYGAFLFSFYNVFYFCFSRKAAAKCVEYFKEEDFCSGRFLWNLPESIVVKFFLKKTYKKVKFYKLFSIPFEDDDPELAGSNAKEAVMQAQNDSDVQQIDTVSADSVHVQNTEDRVTQDKVEVVQAPNSPGISEIAERKGIRISNTSSSSGDAPISPGGTVVDTKDAVVSEKDNRTRWVEAQLLDKRVNVQIPCLPESYTTKKLPVRMRIIFSKKFTNRAFVVNQKQKWFADRSYSIVDPGEDATLNQNTNINANSNLNNTNNTNNMNNNNHSSLPSALSTSSITSNFSEQPRTVSNSSLDTNISTSSQPIPSLSSISTQSSQYSHSRATSNSSNFEQTHSRIPSNSSTSSSSSVHVHPLHGEGSHIGGGGHKESIRRRISVFRSRESETTNTLSSALIIYYHGGGFIAMTSFSHEMYTRKWAVDTGVPILAVDYSLAPNEIYPVQTAECFHAYKWALRHHKQIGSKAEKIILIGDSAGGNLVMGVVNRTILEGIRVPNGVVLAYPALLLQPTPSLSRLCSVIDPLLNMQVLLYVLRQYATKEYINSNDPILSPVLATDDVLVRYPPVRIIVGDMDPLLDDSIFMYKRLKALNKNVEISIQDGFGHGFFNFVGVIPQIHKMLDLVSIWLLEFIDGQPATRTIAEAKQNL